MYVVVVYNRYDPESVDYVVGPFDTVEAAHAWERETFENGTYRAVLVFRLSADLPEHAR